MSEKPNVTMEMAYTPEEKCLNLQNQTKPNEKKPDSALSYLRSLLSDSVVTGVPQIITVGHLLRKIFKIIIFVACFSGFIYQAVSFMNLYYTYPSTIDIDIEYAKNLPAPKLTFCNKNSLIRTEFCSNKSEYCAKPLNITTFCNKYPRFCNETKDANDLQFVVSEILTSDQDYLIEYGQSAEDLIVDCCSTIRNVTSQCINKTEFLIYTDEFNIERTCFTVDFSNFQNVLQQKEILTLDEEATTIGSCFLWTPFVAENVYTVVLHLNPFEYVRPEKIPSAQVAVHSSKTEKNPFLKGFSAKMGKRYTVKLQANEERLLPEPYSTNCKDNSELGDGYSRDVCLSACALKVTFKFCGCAPLGNPHRERIKLCLESGQEKQECGASIDLSPCYDLCPKPCRSFSFDYDVSESDLHSGYSPVDLGEGPISVDSGYNFTSDKLTFIKFSQFINWEEVVVINVLYSKPEIKIYTYKPKYDKIEILGYIGGYSGIWLGISLVAVFDFFETIFVFVCFIYQRSRRK